MSIVAIWKIQRRPPDRLKESKRKDEILDLPYGAMDLVDVENCSCVLQLQPKNISQELQQSIA